MTKTSPPVQLADEIVKFFHKQKDYTCTTVDILKYFGEYT